MGYVLDKSCTDDALSYEGCEWEEGAVDIRSLVNVRGLQLQCARFLNEALVVPVLMYNSDTMICKVN